jgi:hypothetical protein
MEIIEVHLMPVIQNFDLLDIDSGERMAGIDPTSGRCYNRRRGETMGS